MKGADGSQRVVGERAARTPHTKGTGYTFILLADRMFIHFLFIFSFTDTSSRVSLPLCHISN